MRLNQPLVIALISLIFLISPAQAQNVRIKKGKGPAQKIKAPPKDKPKAQLPAPESPQSASRPKNDPLPDLDKSPKSGRPAPRPTRPLSPSEVEALNIGSDSSEQPTTTTSYSPTGALKPQRSDLFVANDGLFWVQPEFRYYFANFGQLNGNDQKTDSVDATKITARLEALYGLLPRHNLGVRIGYENSHYEYRSISTSTTVKYELSGLEDIFAFYRGRMSLSSAVILLGLELGISPQAREITASGSTVTGNSTSGGLSIKPITGLQLDIGDRHLLVGTVSYWMPFERTTTVKSSSATETRKKTGGGIIEAVASYEYVSAFTFGADAGFRYTMASQDKSNLYNDPLKYEAVSTFLFGAHTSYRISRNWLFYGQYRGEAISAHDDPLTGGDLGSIKGAQRDSYLGHEVMIGSALSF